MNFFGTDPAQWLICLTPLGIVWTLSQSYLTQAEDLEQPRAELRRDLGGHTVQTLDIFQRQNEDRTEQVRGAGTSLGVNGQNRAGAQVSRASLGSFLDHDWIEK